MQDISQIALVLMFVTFRPATGHATFKLVLYGLCIAQMVPRALGPVAVPRGSLMWGS
jgi:hypothetical protein